MDPSLSAKRRHILSGPTKLSISRRLMYVVVALLLGLQAGTQYIAFVFDYQDALGRSWRGLYLPLSGLRWYTTWGNDYPNEFDTAIAVCALSCLLGFALAMSLEGERNKMRHLNHTLHGSSRFAEEKDLEREGVLSDDPPSDSVIIGAVKDSAGTIRYLRQRKGHIKTKAQTEAGKSVALVVPTLLSWSHSVLVTDIKGELYSLTAGWRARRAGNRVIRFEPCSGKHARWNPLNEIRIGTEHEYIDVMVLVRVMLDPTGGADKSSYWYNAARNLLVGSILHCLYVGKASGREVTLMDVDSLLSDPDRDSSELWIEMRSNQHCNGSRHKVVAAVGRDMLSKAEEELSGVLSSAQAATEPFRNPLVAYSVSTSDFCLDDLRNGPSPMSLYLVLPPGDIPEAAPLLRILINMNIRKTTPPMAFERELVPTVGVFNRLKGWMFDILPSFFGRRPKARPVRVSSVKSYKYRLLSMFDEFAALGRIDDLQRSIAYVAGFGVMYYIIIQDDGQLKSTETGYGRNETITGNCRTRIAFRPGDEEDVKALSKMAGMTTAYRANVSYSRQAGSKSTKTVSYTEAPRPLLSEDEVRAMPNLIVRPGGVVEQFGSMLISISGCPIIYGTVVPYFADPVFARRVGISVPDSSSSGPKLESMKVVVT